MRIGVIGPLGGEQVAQNIVDALVHMGHKVTALGPAHPSHRNRHLRNGAMLARMALSGVDEKFQSRIARNALEAECDVIINNDLRLMPEVVARMRQGGARIAFWFVDPVSHLVRQLMILAPYDALFFKEPHLVERLSANLDLPVHYLPEACNPDCHKPVVAAGTDPHLVVPGTMYPIRIRLLERLIAKGIPLKLYGVGIPRWIGETPTREMHAGSYVTRDQKAMVFRSAAGVLNTMHPAEIAGVNGRLFQAAGCGAAVISEFRPTLPDLFDVGSEILAFNDFDELVNQATRLLNENGLSTRLGDAAARRAHRDHTYENRLLTILETVQ